MLANIEALHVIQCRCAANLPLTQNLSDWLADSIKRYLEHECESLNEAFGVIQDRGGVPWWLERALRERDAALRELASVHFAELSPYGQAKAVAKLTSSYAANNWPRDRHLGVMPDRYRGTPQEQLWAAFHSNAKMPVSERRLRTLLAD